MEGRAEAAALSLHKSFSAELPRTRRTTSGTGMVNLKTSRTQLEIELHWSLQLEVQAREKLPTVTRTRPASEPVAVRLGLPLTVTRSHWQCEGHSEAPAANIEVQLALGRAVTLHTLAQKRWRR